MSRCARGTAAHISQWVGRRPRGRPACASHRSRAALPFREVRHCIRSEAALTTLSRLWSPGARRGTRQATVLVCQRWPCPSKSGPNPDPRASSTFARPISRAAVANPRCFSRHSAAGSSYFVAPSNSTSTRVPTMRKPAVGCDDQFRWREQPPVQSIVGGHQPRLQIRRCHLHDRGGDVLDPIAHRVASQCGKQMQPRHPLGPAVGEPTEMNRCQIRAVQR